MTARWRSGSAAMLAQLASVDMLDSAYEWLPIKRRSAHA
jgi:hypothetical protein